MRRSLPAVFLVLGALALLPSRSAAFPHDHPHDDASLTAIEAAWRGGALDDEEALLLALQRIFEPDTLPDAYRADTSAPVRCATPIVIAAQRAALDPVDRTRVDAWLSPTVELARRNAYVTAQGRFTIDYVTSGSSTVPLDDVAPSNGVPDYVERVGQYLEQSWETEFVQLGFVAPDLSGGPYRVNLRRIGAYGFTSLTDVGTAGTEITMHNDFLGFPPNDDPEGDQWGAAKVTAAHELKHASQWTNNGWTASGLWIEIDATWIEDVVFDPVNDYYNYLTFRSPITDPPRPLDDGGSGAYAEAIWQHWMSETLGIESINALWGRRSQVPQETMLESYAWTITQFGAPMAERWVEFASWNYASGDHAIEGFGYEEAANFPTPPLTGEAAALPASFSGAVERLAAHFLRVEGFTTGETGVVTLTPQTPPTSPLRARVIVERRDGTRTVEDLAFVGGQTVQLGTPLQDVEALVLVLGHGTLTQGPAVYEVQIAEEIRRPAAAPLFAEDAVRSRVAVGSSSERTIGLENVGAPGSVLDYEAAVIPAAIVARSISGSTLAVDRGEYAPGTSVTLHLEVTNRSVDFEWLRSIAIDFPPGVTVRDADDFLAPEGRRLGADGSAGDGVTVTWSDPDGAWGNVENGESAVAKIDLDFAPALHGDLVIPYTLTGDGFGTGDSTVEAAVLLQGPASPLIEVETPGRIVRVGQTVTLQWSAAVDGPVALDLSRDGGSSWETLSESTENDGAFDWTVTGPATFDARLRVRNAADAAQSATTAASFAVLPTVAWADVAAGTGQVPAGEDGAVEVRFDASELDAGVYTAQLVLVYDGMDEPAVLPVELDVSSGGTSTPVPAGRGVVHGARPNPFNPTTRVELTLHRASNVRVDVFDARGRHVRTLADGPRIAGEHAVSWNGTDAQDLRVASGVYLYVVDLDGERTVGKISLVE